MTKFERKQMARAFALAKEHLADTKHGVGDKSRYICFALNNARKNKLITYAAQKRAVNLIMGRLYPCTEFSGWMEKNAEAGIRREVIDDKIYNNGAAMQAHRQAWLDRLIVEFGGVA